LDIVAAVVGARDAEFAIEHVQLEQPRSDELLVRLVAAGMCHTDLSVVSQATPFPLPAILGHEGAGIVEEAGAGVTEFKPGDPVILSFAFCGACRACRSGKPVYCDHWLPLNLLGGSRLDGSSAYSAGGGSVHGHFFGQSSFATHTVVTERAAVKAPGDVPLPALAPFGCGVQTGAGAVFHVAAPQPGSDMVVFGAGGVGLSAVMAARLTPAARLIAVDVNPRRLRLAADLGATHTVNSADADAVETVRELTAGGADVAIETSGQVPVLGQAVRSLRSAGTCVVIGAPPRGSELAVDVTDLLGRGIRLIGTNQGDSAPRDFIPRLIDLYRAGVFPVDRIVTNYAFTAVNQAAGDARSGTAVKPVLLLE
jgi:aryl-alcohol dehydrogenase